MALSTKSITVFAAVEALRDNQADIRHALATLFEPDLAKFNGEVYDPEKVAAEVNRQYQLGVTADIMAGFAEIFEQRGWLQRVLQGATSAYVVSCVPSSKVPAELQKFTDTASEIASAFRSFIKNISPLSQVDRTDSELIDNLVEWLMLLDRAGGENLKSVSTTYKIGKKIVLNVDDATEGGSPSESTFLCARFVEFLFESDSKFIPFLIELSEVGLVTEVVRDFQRPSSAVQSTDLSVYLDAPLALDYLGLSGAPQQKAIELVLKGFTAIGGSIRLFRYSVEEMQAALGALLHRPVAERTGPTADALRRREVLEPFVRQVAAQPDKFLAAKGVAVIDEDLDMYPNSHKFFTRNAYEELYSQIAWVKDDAARHHDAAIATLAFRKRAGRRSGDLFDVRHVVVTRNPSFPGVARRIALQNHFIGGDHVGPVIHQRQLATAIWLRRGSGSDIEIPRSNILSACRRVLTLRKNIVERVNQFKEALTPEQSEQLEILMASDRSAQVLMDKTLGSANIIDSSNIELLLEEMKKAQIAEYSAQRDAEYKALERQAAERERELKTHLAAARVEAETAQIDKAVAAERMEEVTDQVVTRVNRLIEGSRRLWGTGVAILCSIIAFLSFYGNVENKMIAFAAFAICLVGGLVLQFTGFIRRRILDDRFRRRDHELLDRACLETGLITDEVLQKLRYTGHSFERIGNV